jgi:diguanylate cyclase (GGDEF)-like protein
MLSVTVSLGGTAVEPSATSLEEAIKRADEALYRSKSRGRNRLSVC